jgi:hypothetical protein
VTVSGGWCNYFSVNNAAICLAAIIFCFFPSKSSSHMQHITASTFDIFFLFLRPHAIRCTRLEDVRRGSRTLEKIAVEMDITNASEEVVDVPLKEEGR